MVDVARSPLGSTAVAAEAAIVVLDGPLGTELAARGRDAGAALERRGPARRAGPRRGPRDPPGLRARGRGGAHGEHVPRAGGGRRAPPGPSWRRGRSRWRARPCATRARRTWSPAASRRSRCYRPDLSPADARQEHAKLAQALAGAGVDLLLCETFPHVGEALVALEEAVATGVEAWVSFTAGPGSDLLSPEHIGLAARGRPLGREGRARQLHPCDSHARAHRAARGVRRPVRGLRERGRRGRGARLGRWRRPARLGGRALRGLAPPGSRRGPRSWAGAAGTGPGRIAALRALVDGARLRARPGGIAALRPCSQSPVAPHGATCHRLPDEPGDASAKRRGARRTRSIA